MTCNREGYVCHVVNADICFSQIDLISIIEELSKQNECFVLHAVGDVCLGEFFWKIGKVKGVGT